MAIKLLSELVHKQVQYGKRKVIFGQYMSTLTNLQNRIEHVIPHYNLMRKITCLSLIHKDIFENLAEGVVNALVLGICGMTRVMVAWTYGQVADAYSEAQKPHAKQHQRCRIVQLCIRRMLTSLHSIADHLATGVDVSVVTLQKICELDSL